MLQIFLDMVVTGKNRRECLNLQLAQETWDRGSLEEKGLWTKPTYRMCPLPSACAVEIALLALQCDFLQKPV